MALPDGAFVGLQEDLSTATVCSEVLWLLGLINSLLLNWTLTSATSTRPLALVVLPLHSSAEWVGDNTFLPGRTLCVSYYMR